MYKFLKYPLFLFFSFFTLYGQSQNSVSGLLIDKDQKPVAFANVVLLQASDSTTVYMGAVSNEAGDYLFENVLPAEYVLSVSFMGYEQVLKLIDVNSDTRVETITLTEDADALAEVTVTGKKPKITRSIDRIIFDVENSTLSTGSSWDILRKTPGVVVTQGQLMVRNGGVAIYINDRKVQLTAEELRELLESYSAANIKAVEVITNPPARYEAEGGAILNIVTSTNLTPGYKGSLNGNYTQGIYPKYQFGTSHYFKTEKLNVFANYSYSPRKEFKNDDSYYNFFDENNRVYSRWNTDFNRTTRSQAHNANLNLDYNINDNNILSFSANALVSPNLRFNNYVETEARNAQFELDSTFVTNSGLENNQENIALDLKYTHKLAKEGAEISANAHYTNYNQDRVQNVVTRYFSPDAQPINEISFFTDAAQNIDILTGQIDFNTPIGTTNFEMGAKSSFIFSESGINYFNTLDNPTLIDDLSDNFEYEEMIHAGYVSISKNWEKWAFKSGLRAEYTDVTGISNSMGEVNTQEYLEFFPTAYLQHQFSEDHVVTADYSRRIARPRYESLNPFRYFLNENDFNAGNPNLRAAISNNYNINYTLQGQYFFDIYYRDNGETPSTLAFQDNENRNIRRVSMNLLGSKSYGLDLAHQRSITNFWFVYGAFSFFHEENTFMAIESNNQVVTNEIDAFYSSIYNSFTLSKDGTFTGELTFLYISDFISGSYNLDPWTTVGIGFRKTLWDNRAELTLNFEDIFNSTNTRLTSRYLNQDNSFFAREENQLVRIGFKYNFGNFRLRDNQRRIEASERDRI